MIDGFTDKNNGVIMALTNDVRSLEESLADLRVNYTDAHPEIKAVVKRTIPTVRPRSTKRPFPTDA